MIKTYPLGYYKKKRIGTIEEVKKKNKHNTNYSKNHSYRFTVFNKSISKILIINSITHTKNNGI